MSLSSYDFIIKLLMLGDSGVGKSSLLSKYIDDKFVQDFISTIGIDFKIKTIKIDIPSLGIKRVKMQIWDTAGQERFRTITKAYYRAAQGVLIVYDITNPYSFQNVRNWIKDMHDHTDNPCYILVANKCDCDCDSRTITTQQGQELAEQYDTQLIETSAKSNINVSLAFETLIQKTVQRYYHLYSQTKETKETKQMNPFYKNKRFYCC